MDLLGENRVFFSVTLVHLGKCEASLDLAHLIIFYCQDQWLPMAAACSDLDSKTGACMAVSVIYVCD